MPGATSDLADMTPGENLEKQVWVEYKYCNSRCVFHITDVWVTLYESRPSQSEIGTFIDREQKKAHSSSPSLSNNLACTVPETHKNLLPSLENLRSCICGGRPECCKMRSPSKEVKAHIIRSRRFPAFEWLAP